MQHMTITITVDPAQLEEEEGTAQFFMTTLSGKRARISVEGLAIDGEITAMSASGS